jgi:capsular exopolysaccharide synthesis family protein
VSRIFELLNKSRGEVADLVRPLVDEQTRRTPQTDGESRASEVFSAAPVAKEAPAAETPSLASIRTLSLRIPAPSPLLPFDGEQWRPNEQYRVLRTKIGQHPLQPKVIVVSSPASGDGKSVTAINTAGALSLKSEADVLLLDADLRKPVIHRQLGLPQSPGLADVLAGACTLEEALVHTKEFPNLYAIASGTTSGNPVELLDSRQWRALCTRLRGMFRYVVIDSPPVAAVADYALIQDVCDGVILVVRPDCTNRDLCRQSLDLVPKAKFLGVLLNCVPDTPLAGRGGADYYYYGGGKKSANHRDGVTV